MESCSVLVSKCEKAPRGTALLKVELVVPDGRADEVVHTVVASARTGKIGDGKVFIYDVAEAIRIRNDDRGEGAL